MRCNRHGDGGFPNRRPIAAGLAQKYPLFTQRLPEGRCGFRFEGLPLQKRPPLRTSRTISNSTIAPIAE
jgi:hypothetical protein